MTDLLSVEPSECTQCGDCASACPAGLIRFNPESRLD